MKECLVKFRGGNNVIEKRGVLFFKYDFILLLKLYKINHISFLGFVEGMLIRLIVRVSPHTIRKLIYSKLLR